ncbi:MAG: hypothetical protein GF331_22510 [Chitinivibrionales bacterium]|nr:hypothetical protein [Chitinivibrionales bacterium]
MAMYLTNVNERDTVVFHAWQSLNRRTRMLLAFGLVITGVIVQVLTFALFPGIVLVAAGNILLLVKGYDNRVDAFTLDMDSKWTRVDRAKVAEVEELNRRMVNWDRSALDITNGMGFWVFALVVAVCAGLLLVGGASNSSPLVLLGVNAMALLIPHWVTGVRSILTTPGVVTKIRLFDNQLRLLQDRLADCAVEYYMLLGGDETRVPRDIKLRIKSKDQHPDFLGLYVQIATNTVNGTAYPYLYTVLVAKKGYGLKQVCWNYSEPHGVTKEYSIEGEVEVLVIRQTTTKTSGYHTDTHDARKVFREGLILAQGAAGGPRE